MFFVSISQEELLCKSNLENSKKKHFFYSNHFTNEHFFAILLKW